MKIASVECTVKFCMDMTTWKPKGTCLIFYSWRTCQIWRGNCEEGWTPFWEEESWEASFLHYICTFCFCVKNLNFSKKKEILQLTQSLQWRVNIQIFYCLLQQSQLAMCSFYIFVYFRKLKHMEGLYFVLYDHRKMLLIFSGKFKWLRGVPVNSRKPKAVLKTVLCRIWMLCAL